MSIEIKVPEVGESVTEVEISQWMVAEGDAIRVDQDLVELETDKVNQVVPSPINGAIIKIIKQPGDTANVGEVIAIVEEGAAGNSPSAATDAPTSDSKATASGDEIIVMPAAQRLIDEKGLNAKNITATGPSGRVLKEDVLAFLENNGKPATKPQASVPAATPQTAKGNRDTERVKMTALRRTIAKQLTSAQQNAALLTTFNEVDMTAIMDIRKRYQEKFVETHGTKLGFMSFFVKAACEALKQFPAVNAEVDGDHVVYRHYCDIGVAIGGGKGLVVPVLRNAEGMGYAEVETTIIDFAKKAKNNQISLADLQGGTFTITNGGVYGSLLSTPIVNPPQSGVLGMHGIQRRPIAVGTPGKDERIEIRPMMYLALTYDHRVVDGREAVTFLRVIKDLIEDPARLLFEI